MKILSRTIGFFILFGVFFQGIFALDAPSNIKLESLTNTSLTLSWDDVDDGLMYYDVYFSDIQGFEIINAEKREFNEISSITINNLEPSTQYYFRFGSTNESLDKSDLSQEYTFTTSGGNDIEFNSAQEFKIDTIEVLAKNQISVSFTSPLQTGDDAERLFRVLERDNEVMEYDIRDSQVDEDNNRKVIITFETNLPIEMNFKLIVISILDQGGRNIQSGIESFENFYIEKEIENRYYNEQTDVIEIIGVTDNEVENQGGIGETNQNQGGSFQELTNGTNTIEENDQVFNELNTNTGNNGESNVSEVEQNTNGVEQEQQEIENPGEIENNETQNTQTSNIIQEGLNSASEVSGSLIDGEIKDDVYSAGKNVESLPTTGPTHLLMLFIALMLGSVAFVYKSKK